jgi:hypothetical protein
MPDQPTWCPRLEAVIAALEASGEPWVDAATVEHLLGVSRRRAQQIIRPCVTKMIGRTGLAGKADFILRLREVASGMEAAQETDRKRKVASLIGELRRDRMEGRSLMVESRPDVVNRELANLPAGVSVEPGRITVEFNEPSEALEKLLALAMAIGNNIEQFHEMGKSTT